VGINGAFFGNNPSLIVDQGITASITSSSGSQINARFDISINDVGGFHFVFVENAQGISNGANFFVQLPTSFAPFDFPGAPNGVGPLIVIDPSGDVVSLTGTVLLTNKCGVYRNLAYQLVDQQRQPILSGFNFTERFFNYSGFLTTPPPQSGSSSGGLVQDTQFVGRAAFDCLLPGESEEFNQDFVVTIGSRPFTLTTVVFISRGRAPSGYFVDVSIDQP